MNFIFPYIGNVITPTDELIFFRGVDTTNQNMWMYDGSWMDDGHLLMMIYGGFIMFHSYFGC